LEKTKVGVQQTYLMVVPLNATGINHSMRELAIQYEIVAKKKITERVKIDGPKTVHDFMKNIFVAVETEQLWILCLDTKNRIIVPELVYIGTVNESAVRVGELFRKAIAVNAMSIVMAHNHPSGESLASIADIRLTKAVYEAGKILDIPLQDHYIYGASNSYYSLREAGLGFNA
jgi:DNA repair protein RadC